MIDFHGLKQTIINFMRTIAFPSRTATFETIGRCRYAFQAGPFALVARLHKFAGLSSWPRYR